MTKRCRSLVQSNATRTVPLKRLKKTHKLINFEVTRQSPNPTLLQSNPGSTENDDEISTRFSTWTDETAVESQNPNSLYEIGMESLEIHTTKPETFSMLNRRNNNLDCKARLEEKEKKRSEERLKRGKWRFTLSLSVRMNLRRSSSKWPSSLSLWMRSSFVILGWLPIRALGFESLRLPLFSAKVEVKGEFIWRTFEIFDPHQFWSRRKEVVIM